MKKKNLQKKTKKQVTFFSIASLFRRSIFLSE